MDDPAQVETRLARLEGANRRLMMAVALLGLLVCALSAGSASLFLRQGSANVLEARRFVVRDPKTRNVIAEFGIPEEERSNEGGGDTPSVRLAFWDAKGEKVVQTTGPRGIRIEDDRVGGGSAVLNSVALWLEGDKGKVSLLASSNLGLTLSPVDKAESTVGLSAVLGLTCSDETQHISLNKDSIMMSGPAGHSGIVPGQPLIWSH